MTSFVVIDDVLNGVDLFHDSQNGVKHGDAGYSLEGSEDVSGHSEHCDEDQDMFQTFSNRSSQNINIQYQSWSS